MIFENPSETCGIVRLKSSKGGYADGEAVEIDRGHSLRESFRAGRNNAERSRTSDEPQIG